MAMLHKLVRAMTACALAGASCAAEQSASERLEPAKPAMWRAADDDTEIYLFGTFHLLPKDLEWRTDLFTDAMAQTDVTVLEVDTDSPAARADVARLMQAYGRNPDGVTLSSILGPDRAAKLKEVAEGYGVPMATLETARPWFAILTLSLVGMQREGFDPASGVESVVDDQAQREDDERAYLETIEYQIKALASLDGPELLAEFDVTMEQFDDLKGFADRMLTAWRSGDVAAIEEIVIADLRETAPGAYERLIVDRNRNWAKTMTDWLEGDGEYFVAVGAGHLVGPDSVVAMLRDGGWTVERVQ